MDDSYKRLKTTGPIRPKSYKEIAESLGKGFSDWIDKYNKEAMESKEGKKWLEEQKKKEKFKASLRKKYPQLFRSLENKGNKK